MVSLGVSKLGTTTVHFVILRSKVNGEYFGNKLLKLMLPEMRNLGGGGHFISQQEGARAHTAKNTVAYLNDSVPQNWLSNSPDMNPVDYSIWENLLQRVYININGLGMCNT